MKILTKLIPVALVLLLAAGWFVSIVGATRAAVSTAQLVAAAEESVEAGLYDQAIEQYETVISTDPSEQMYLRLDEIYGMYYSEEPKDDIRTRYISTMVTAANAYPLQVEFWEKACDLYMESEDYSSAYKLLVRASNMGASSDKLSELGTGLAYTTTVGTRLYYNIKNSLNGCMVVDTGSEYQVLDDSGKRIRDGYKLIGYINADGLGVYVNDIDARLVDSGGVARGRYDIDVKDAGELDMDTGLVPVLVGDKWRYLDVVEGTLRAGEYQQAGCFSEGKAAVQDDRDAWYLIDANGEKASDDFEDIKLDLHGSWMHSGVMLAKKADKYALFDTSLLQIGSFSCDDIDVYAEENAPIAFEQDGKWGFVNPDGAVVREPEYDCAKSFANGLAAVREKGAVWGYLDGNYRVVIECEYKDALYFNSGNTSWVSTGEDAYQLLSFVFN